MKKYESGNTKDPISREILEDIFANSFDLSISYNIDTVYIDPKNTKRRDWASNYFSENCVEGYMIGFNHNFYDESALPEFKEFAKLLNEISGDVDRLTSMCDVKDIFFTESGNSSISIIIR